jgi:hypothetical protein
MSGNFETWYFTNGDNAKIDELKRETVEMRKALRDLGAELESGEERFRPGTSLDEWIDVYYSAGQGGEYSKHQAFTLGDYRVFRSRMVRDGDGFSNAVISEQIVEISRTKLVGLGEATAMITAALDRMAKLIRDTKEEYMK